MPAAGTGDDNDVLVLDVSNPRWEPSSASLPHGNMDGDILVWSGTAWVVFDDATQQMRWWDASTNEWKEIEVPADDGKILQTASPEGVKFDYLAWR